MTQTKQETLKPEERMYLRRTGRSCVFKNYIHLIFVTKYRRDVLTNSMLKTLKNVFYETCQQMECELLEFGGEEDHIPLMMSLHPKKALSHVVGKLKEKSSYILRRDYQALIKNKLWGNHFWSPSYCVVSCGGAPLDIIKSYIKHQRKPPTEKMYRNL